MVLHGALCVIPAAHMRRAVVRCPALGKFSQKGIPLSFNSSLEKFPSPFSQKISQRVHDSVSTRKFDDGSLLHDGGGSFGWWLVSQRQTNKMHRRRSNRPDTRFTHSSSLGRCAGTESTGRSPRSSAPSSARAADRRSARSHRPAWGCTDNTSH